MHFNCWSLLAFLSICQAVNALQCYTCEYQEGNKDKCIKYIKQCGPEGKDACMSVIDYRVPPYWTPRGERTHFVSKTCASYETCKREKQKYLHTCKRDWYNDWKCIECCMGDQCNFYVTLEAGRLPAHRHLVVFLLFVLLGLRRIVL